MGLTLAHTAVPTTLPLSVTLLLAGVVSFVVVCLGALALTQRRSLSYLLLFLALSALLARTAVAGLTVAGVLPTTAHHLLEHGLDFVMAALVLVAVYYARRIERNVRA